MEKEARRGKPRNRWIWIVGGIVVIGVAVVLGNRFVRSRTRTQSQSEAVTAIIGDMSGSVTGSGHLQPRQDVSLSMATTGIVKSVNVQVGDTVTAGEVLIRLDDTDASQAVAKAELQVSIDQLNVDSAQLTLDSRVHWAPSPDKVAAAQADVANAEATLQQAQSAYDRVAWMPGVSASQASLQLQQATNNYNLAKANLNYLYSNRPDIKSAANALESANLSLQQAQVDLESAQAALAKTVLRAPFDGTVTAVNVSAGEAASGVVIEVASMNSLEAVLDIDEIDLSSLAVGQPAVVTLATWPDAQIEGRVISIAPQAEQNTSSDVVNYEVRLGLQASDLPLRAGMTANATITTFSLKNVLLVPNSAIIPNRETGKYYVNLITQQGIQKTEVTIGAHNDTYTQILSGLKAGDKMLPNGATPVRTVSPSSTGRFGGFFGGGGGQ